MQFQVVHVFLDLHFGLVFDVPWENHQELDNYCQTKALQTTITRTQSQNTSLVMTCIRQSIRPRIVELYLVHDNFMLASYGFKKHPLDSRPVVQKYIPNNSEYNPASTYWFYIPAAACTVLVPPYLHRIFFAWWLTPCRSWSGNRPTKFWSLRLRDDIKWHLWLFLIIQFQVGALPQPADLERQRERIMAEAWSALKRCGLNMFERFAKLPRTAVTQRALRAYVFETSLTFQAMALQVQSVSNSLSDRQRDSNERLQKDLAEATVWRSEKPDQFDFSILGNNNRVRIVFICVHAFAPDFQPFATFAVVWTSLDSRDDSLPQGC